MALDNILNKEMERREFLKYLGIGAMALLFGAKNVYGDIISDKIDSRMKDVLKPKGDIITKYNYPFDDGSKINLRFEYLCGPRGGSGALRVLFYLDEDEWHSFKGIDKIRFWIYSLNRTLLSKDVYEVNANFQDSKATNMPLEYVMFEGDYIFENILEKPLYTALGKIKIKKSDIAAIFNIKKTLEDVFDYQTKQEIIENGNLIAKDHVWFNEIGYGGYGKIFDKDLFLERPSRAPKAVDYIIKQGEASILGWGFHAISRSYKDVNFLEGNLGRKRVNSEVKGCAPLDMKHIVGRETGKTIEEGADETEE